MVFLKFIYKIYRYLYNQPIYNHVNEVCFVLCLYPFIIFHSLLLIFILNFFVRKKRVQCLSQLTGQLMPFIEIVGSHRS